VPAEQPEATARGITVNTSIGSPGDVMGDATRLRQGVDNLLSNAIGFTPLAVAYPRTLVPRVLERFVRASARVTGSSRDTASALAIAKAISDAHGGRILLMAEMPGTSFIVWLPWPVAATAAA